MLEYGFAVLFFRLVLSEPTIQAYLPSGGQGAEIRESAGLGFGWRVRVPVSEHNALRLRLDFVHLGQEPDLDIDPALSLDFLRHGRTWQSGWYQGIGAGWVRRVRSVSQQKESADGASGSLILGREQSVGRGQIVLEARLVLTTLSGQVDSHVAFSMAYRHHFK
jgi:hypothetical protein